tara:strand:- start:359 stop:1093 length:735 start_codon:yes stop_codon:yes gene_type:complete
MLIDINVDTGEGFNNEAKIIPLVSSCNIACGGHTGDLLSIREVIEYAKRYNTRIGAHPSFDDKENFGRISMDVESDELYEDLLIQIKSVVAISGVYGVKVSYIKPHGALYHRVCNDPAYAEVLVNLIQFEMPEVLLMGLPNCVAEELAMKKGVGYIREGFADRVYEEDGSLRSRNLEGSVLSTKEDILSQFLKISGKEPIKSYSGKEIIIDVDSICFHGDHKGAEKNLEFVVNSVKDYNIQIGI